MQKVLRPLIAWLAAATLLALGGCAMPRVIDSDVQSFVRGTAVRPATYRFDRLPSQADAPAQEQLESMAAAALVKVELTPALLVSGAVAGTASAAPSARYAVQVTARVEAIASPYSGPVFGGFWGMGGGHHHGGFGIALEPTWYRYAVHFLLRDSATGVAVYESGASFDGPWADSGKLLPVMLEAALQGYPNPPSGPRKVVIELPGDPSAAP
jgi:hypothetical protein